MDFLCLRGGPEILGPSGVVVKKSIGAGGGAGGELGGGGIGRGDWRGESDGGDRMGGKWGRGRRPHIWVIFSLYLERVCVNYRHL